MRLAAIDIGTNSVHMIVVEVHRGGQFEVIDREKEMVRLGAGGLDGKAITDSAMTGALQALSTFRRLADSHKVDEVLAAATSATREAKNGGDFLEAIAAETGIRAQVITGKEEARLIHLAAAFGVNFGKHAGVVIDIGGGSVEITYGTSTAVQLARSFKIGVIRLTERFVKTDPLSERDERRLSEHVAGEIDAHVATILAHKVTRVVGTSGTILSLGAVAAAERGAVPDDLRGLRVPAKALHRLRKRLVASNLQERLKIPGLDPRRADIAVAGAVLLDTIVQRLEADEFTLCDLALREGLVLDYIHKNSLRIASVSQYPDVRRRSVEELGERCRYWREHAQHVAGLALALFDQTAARHKLGPREREWLEYGALLHDVGSLIGYKSHHKHSYYLIRHGELRGFEHEEVEVIGLLARYHRQAEPKKSHEGYRDLRAPLRRIVKTLAAFLRLAEGLDRSHSQIITKLDVLDRGDHCLVRLHCSSDAELELWAAHRHVSALEGALGCTVRFVLAGARQLAKAK
jgi:exopolyphosphatase/guanosine-5'-triphosphate,3'-diphosphate pyrophosphatase